MIVEGVHSVPVAPHCDLGGSLCQGGGPECVLTRCPRVCGLRVPHTPLGRLLSTLYGGGGLLRGCVPSCVWVQGAVGSGFPSLCQLNFCFLGQNVSWPRWLQGQVFCFCFFGKLCCRLLFFFFFNHVVLWYFSSLGIIFNSKTGLTAVAFFFHLFL